MKPRNLTKEEIVQRWIEGTSFTSLAKTTGVCRTTIGKIIQDALGRQHMINIRAAQRPITNGRKFSATNLDAGVKEALRQHVKTKGISMSQFIAEAIEEKLDDLGIKIEKKPPYKGEPLPFEAVETK